MWTAVFLNKYTIALSAVALAVAGAVAYHKKELAAVYKQGKLDRTSEYQAAYLREMSRQLDRKLEMDAHNLKLAEAANAKIAKYTSKRRVTRAVGRLLDAGTKPAEFANLPAASTSQYAAEVTSDFYSCLRIADLLGGEAAAAAEAAWTYEATWPRNTAGTLDLQLRQVIPGN